MASREMRIMSSKDNSYGRSDDDIGGELCASDSFSDHQEQQFGFDQVSTSSNNDSAMGVSAIVVSYYTGPLLARAIASLKHQPEIDEIIIVDNGNWDDAVLNAADIGGDDGRDRPIDVHIISGQGNIGFSSACNLGARKAKFSHLLFLNPDAVMPQGSMATFLEGCQNIEDSDQEDEHYKPWMMGVKLVGSDGIEQSGARRHTLTPWRALVEATKLYHIAPKHPYFRRFNMNNDPCPGEVCMVPVTSGACFLIPKQDYFQIDGMDENFFLHVEDIDFCLRFAKAGGRVFYNPNVEVMHFKGSSRTSKTSIEYYKTKGMQRYFAQHFTGVYPPLFLPLVSVLLWVRFGMFALVNTLRRSLGFLGLRSRRGYQVTERAKALAPRPLERN